MPGKRYSRFDPEYGEDTKNLFEGFEDTDDEYSGQRKPSRLKNDEAGMFGGPQKKKELSFFNKENNENFDDEDDYYGNGGRRRAPFLVRVFAWLAVIVIIFATGYFATNYFIGLADDASKPKIEDQVGTAEDVTLEDKKESGNVETAVGGKIVTKDYAMYIPNGKDFTVRNVSLVHGRVEQDMQKILEIYFENLREAGISSADIHVLNLFKSDDLVYLNVDANFEKTIAGMNNKKAVDTISGLLSTLSKNFAVKRVKFYINTLESEVKKPVDLSREWEL